MDPTFVGPTQPHASFALLSHVVGMVTPSRCLAWDKHARTLTVACRGGLSRPLFLSVCFPTGAIDLSGSVGRGMGLHDPSKRFETGESVANLNTNSSWGRAALSVSSNGLATRWTVCCNAVVGNSGVEYPCCQHPGQVPSEISPVPPRLIRPKPLYRSGCAAASSPL